MKPFAINQLNLKLPLSLLLVTVTIIVYWQTGNHDFISLDDGLYIAENPHVRGGLTLGNIFWAFTTFQVANWHPITWMSHMVDCHLYGLDPKGHHLTNVLFHAANALLLFFLLVRMTSALWRSFIVTALFALHPLHVESVAWIAERKDLLSTFFLLLTIWFYSSYAQQKSKLSYYLSLVAFILGLLAKPMLVSVPIILLLLDYWPLGRLTRCRLPNLLPGHQSMSAVAMWQAVYEKLPFFILAAASSCMTIYAQISGKAIASVAMLPLMARLENALLSYGAYLIKTFWPVRLAVFYPLAIPIPTGPCVAAGFAVVGMTCFVIWEKDNSPYLITGWFWYLITLFPVIGIIQVGLQSMADRYTYIPLVGIFILLVWATADIFTRLRVPRNITAICAVILLLSLSIRCVDQVRLWQNDLTLFGHALSVTRNNYYAAKIIGDTYQQQRNHAEAIRYYRTALDLQPNVSLVYLIEKSLGSSLAAVGKIDEAAYIYNSAISHNPSDHHALYQLGQLAGAKGEIYKAIECYRKAIAFEPDFADAHYSLGLALAKQGDESGALNHFLATIRLQPAHAEAHNYLGVAYARRREYQLAMTHFRHALKLRPTYVEAQLNLKKTEARMRNYLGF